MATNLLQSLPRSFRQSFPNEDSSENGCERKAPVQKSGTIGSAHRRMQLQHCKLKKNNYSKYDSQKLPPSDVDPILYKFQSGIKIVDSGVL